MSPNANDSAITGRSPRAKARVARVLSTRSGRKRATKRGSDSTERRETSTNPLRCASSINCSGAHRNLASSQAAALTRDCAGMAYGGQYSPAWRVPFGPAGTSAVWVASATGPPRSYTIEASLAGSMTIAARPARYRAMHSSKPIVGDSGGPARCSRSM